MVNTAGNVASARSNLRSGQLILLLVDGSTNEVYNNAVFSKSARPAHAIR